MSSINPNDITAVKVDFHSILAPIKENNPINEVAKKTLCKAKRVKKSKRRCWSCSKKLSLAESSMACRCKKIFCSAHRSDVAHDCTFDYKASARATLLRNNPQVVCSKLEKI